MFYNDAYERDTLQAKHPWALGRPAARGVGRDLARHRAADPDGARHRYRHLGRGPAALPRAQRLSRGDVPHVLLQPARRRRRRASRACSASSPRRPNASSASGAWRRLRDLAAAVAGHPHRGRRARRGRRAARPAIRPTCRSASPTWSTPAAPRGWARPPGSRPARPPRRGRAAAGRPRAGLAAGPHPGRRARSWSRTWPRRSPTCPRAPGTQSPTQAVAVPIASARQDEAGVAGFLVVGLNPHRRYDDSYRGFVELIANQIASGLANAAQLRGRAAPGRGARRARPRQDRLLQQRQPRVPHAADADHGAGRRAAVLARRSDGDPRLREELEVIERNALRLGKLVNTLLDFSRIQAGRIDARFEPVDLAAATAELASVFRSAVERAGLDVRRRLPAAARTGLHRPGDVGEDRPQPALQRPEVHLHRRDRRPAAAGGRRRAADRHRHRHRHPGRRAARGCSSGSTGSPTPAAARGRAAGSGWPWSASS